MSSRHFLVRSWGNHLIGVAVGWMVRAGAQDEICGCLFPSCLLPILLDLLVFVLQLGRMARGPDNVSIYQCTHDFRDLHKVQLV